MNSHATWVLVADASRARLFASSESPKRPLSLVREFDHPEGRARNQDLVSDRPGRAQQAAPPGATGPSFGNRSAMDPPTDPKTVEAERFAREIADALGRHLADNSYDHLVLVSPPQFLGHLRDSLPEQVRKRVAASLDKDLTHIAEHELPDRLSGVLAELRTIRPR